MKKMAELYALKKKEFADGVRTGNLPDSSESGFVIKGDLSGIQAFIFNIPSKRASMYLKGRSVYVQLLSEVVARFVHQKMKQGISFDEAVVYKGGGNFMLYYPDAGDLPAQIAPVQEDIDRILFSAHRGGLYLALAGVSCRAGYQQQLTCLLQQRKKQKFKGLGQRLFETYDKVERRSQSGEPETEEEIQDMSRFYRSFYGLAESYMTCQDLSFAESEVYVLSEMVSYEAVFSAFGQRVEFADHRLDVPMRMVNKIDIRSFDELAGLSEGAEKLALLKVDVDNMGALFEGKGLEQTKVISDCLGFFFEEHLNTLIDEYRSDVTLNDGSEKQDARLIYTVYSGGDDAFLIGPWNVMVDFASVLQREFLQYIPTESGLGLSASITIVDKNYPVIQAADVAESWLHLAKQRDGKNAVCLFGEVFSWNEWGYILKIVELLHGIIEETPGNPKSIIRKVESTTSAFRKITQDMAKHDELKMQSIYKLMYYIRNLKSKKEELATIYKEIILEGFIRPESFTAMNKQGLIKQEGVNYMIVPAACRLAEFYQRKGEENE